MTELSQLIKKTLEKRGCEVTPFGEVDDTKSFNENFKVTRPVAGQQKVVVVDSIGKIVGEQG